MDQSQESRPFHEIKQLPSCFSIVSGQVDFSDNGFTTLAVKGGSFLSPTQGISSGVDLIWCGLRRRHSHLWTKCKQIDFLLCYHQSWMNRIRERSFDLSKLKSHVPRIWTPGDVWPICRLLIILFHQTNRVPLWRKERGCVVCPDPTETLLGLTCNLGLLINCRLL